MATIKPANPKWGMRVEKSTNQFLAQPGGRVSIQATPVLEALEYRFAGFARTMNGNPAFQTGASRLDLK
jgi:hypothetical protein